MLFHNLHEHQQYFRNELICVQYLEEQRWGGKPECPHCGSEHYYRTQTRLKHPDLKDYKDFICKACRKKYSVLTGTICESSKVSLQKWLQAIYIATAHKKGISSLQLSRNIGVTQRTAWFMLHRIREMVKEKKELVLSGTVYCDETFHGGKNKNRHWDKKVKGSTGRSFIDKVPILGMLQKDGPLICRVVSDTVLEIFR